MTLSDLSPAAGAKKQKKRIGRGPGSGTGKTAGKGHKGQKARSGGGVRPGFEGGQMRLTQRVRKRGFTNKWAKQYTEINVDMLNQFEDGEVIDAAMLKQRGCIKKICDGLVVLGNGDVTKKVEVRAVRFSKTAEEKIKAAGGKATVV